MRTLRQYREALAQSDGAWAVLAAVLVFLIYQLTLCPAVAFTDTGELAAVCVTLGIAHPTGYPLFTLLGRLWSMLAPGGDEIAMLNRLASVWTALGVGVLVLVFLEILGRTFGRELRRPLVRRLVALSAALCVGLSSTVWAQSTALEVYSLHLFLISLVLFSFLRALSAPDSLRWLAFAAFALGMSFANHMTTVLLAPGFIILYAMTVRPWRNGVRSALRVTPFFVLGLSLYLYLPVRSSSAPAMDWGHPATVERLLWHVSGKQYRVWMFSGADVMMRQFARYVSEFTGEFHWILLPLLLIGVVTLIARDRRTGLCLALVWATTLAYATNYDIFDIESYFLLAIIAVGCVLVIGMARVVQWTQRGTPAVQTVALALLIALPVVPYLLNRERVDESRNRIAEEFTMDVLQHLPPNAVVFSSQWDYFVSPALYLQSVRRVRPDVLVIDKSLLQNRSWYFMHLRSAVPALMQRCSSETDRFLVELAKFEHEQPFNPAVIQLRWNEFLAALVADALRDGPVLSDVRIEPEFPTQFIRTPAGLFFRLTPPGTTAAPSYPHLAEGSGPAVGPVEQDLVLYQVQVCASFADWSQKQGNAEESRKMQELARAVGWGGGRLAVSR